MGGSGDGRAQPVSIWSSSEPRTERGMSLVYTARLVMSRLVGTTQERRGNMVGSTRAEKHTLNRVEPRASEAKR